MESLDVNEHRKIKSQFQLGKQQKKQNISQTIVTWTYLILIFSLQKLLEADYTWYFNPKSPFTVLQ